MYVILTGSLFLCRSGVWDLTSPLSRGEKKQNKTKQKNNNNNKTWVWSLAYILMEKLVFRCTQSTFQWDTSRDRMVVIIMVQCAVLLLLRVRRSRRKYVALPICAWNWPSTSDCGVDFVGISFPYAWYLCVAGPHKFSSSVRVGIFKGCVW